MTIAHRRVLSCVGGMSLILDKSLDRLIHTLIFCRKDCGTIYVRCALSAGWHVTLGALQCRWTPQISSSPFEAFRRWSPLQAFVKGTFEGCFAEDEAPFVTEGYPFWRSLEPSWKFACENWWVCWLRTNDWEELKTTIESNGASIWFLRLSGEVVAPAEYSGVTTINGRSG